MKNRYDNLLRKHNQDILALVPYNPILFHLTALEIKKLCKNNVKILEIGCGEGDSALPILRQTSASLDLLDTSPEMIELCKKRLQEYKKRTHYICKDASEYLKEVSSYDIIFSSWTIHNFKQKDKQKIFKDIYNGLQDDGYFVLADKVYPTKNWRKLFDIQKRRYMKYLPSSVAEAITQHELEDASAAYRMEEKTFLQQMKNAGFKKIEIVDRIERDIVVISQK